MEGWVERTVPGVSAIKLPLPVVPSKRPTALRLITPPEVMREDVDGVVNLYQTGGTTE